MNVEWRSFSYDDDDDDGVNKCIPAVPWMPSHWCLTHYFVLSTCSAPAHHTQTHINNSTHWMTNVSHYTWYIPTDMLAVPSYQLTHNHSQKCTWMVLTFPRPPIHTQSFSFKILPLIPISTTGVVSTTWHLLSVTQFLEQCLDVSHWHVLSLRWISADSNDNISSVLTLPLNLWPYPIQSKRRHLWSSSSSQLVIRRTRMSTVGDRAFPVAGTVCRPTSPQLQRWLSFGTASKLTFSPDHFLTNCFQFLVLYTVYSSDLAVLYLGHSK